MMAMISWGTLQQRLYLSVVTIFMAPASVLLGNAIGG